MPFACPLPFFRRVGQASVNRHVLRLTEPRHRPHLARLVDVRLYHTQDDEHHVPIAASPVARDSAGGSQSQIPVQPNDAGPRRGAARKPPRNIRARKRASAHGPITLKGALLMAAEKGLAGPLHVDANDISFTNSKTFDWVVSINEDYARDYSNDSRVPPIDSTKRDVPSSTANLLALQRLLAKVIADMADRRTTASTYWTKPFVSPASLVIDLEPKEEALLTAWGYDGSELHNWTTILTAADSTQAARLLTGRAGPPESLVDDHGNTPPFIFLYFLRRRRIGPDALRMLVKHLPIWYRNLAETDHHHHSHVDNVSQDILQASQHGDEHESQTDSSSLQSVAYRACVRLLRHARLVWPEALPVIADHLTSFLRLSARAELALLEGEMPVASIARLTSLLNRALYLISEPAAVEPFKSAIHQEAAQAVILRHMAEHNPPLVINREGYRAVTRVQLTQAKTAEESEWARLKSPSWPPWKEDRTGMDANVGLEYGVSRARHVLNRMQEAGYPLQTWESIALIYAGWDSDLSPTIQTRAIMLHSNQDRLASQLWAARIRSTRTVEQAWACFLSYDDLHSQPEQDVYLAMFEKIVEERKRHRLDLAHPTLPSNNIARVNPVLPGDMKEVFPPPPSLHQATYTKSPPPSVRQLHEQMMHRKLPPSGRTLAFLMNHAESLEEGLGYLKSTDKQYRNIVNNLGYDTKKRQGLTNVPDSVFAAVIHLLARFPHTPLSPHTPIAQAAPVMHNFGPKRDLDLRQPLARAIFLLDTQRPLYLPSWNAILVGLARRKAPVIWHNRLYSQARIERGQESRARPKTEALDKIALFELTKQIVKVMREIDLNLDVIGFRQFCIITEHAALASTHFQASRMAPMAQSKDMDPSSTKHGLVHESAAFVRYQFWTLVGHSSNSTASGTTASGLPRLLTTPSPAVIHAYIRALGFMQDYEGLQELVYWMQEYWPELEARKDLDRNGVVVFRRCIVAFRVFLEGRWQNGLHPDAKAVDESNGDERKTDDEYIEEGNFLTENSAPLGAPRDLLDQVWTVIDTVEDWGGWASKEEVEMYMERMEDASPS